MSAAITPILNAINGFLIVYECLPAGIHFVCTAALLFCAGGLILNFLWSVMG